MVLLVYDITNRASLENLQSVWIQDIKQSLSSALVLLVGTKADLVEGPKGTTKMQVPEDVAAEVVEKFALNGQFRVSSKSGLGIKELTEYMAKALYHNNSLIVQNFAEKKAEENSQKPIPKVQKTKQEDMPLVYKL